MFSFIVLILAAHWLSVASAHLQLRYEYASLAAATAFFTSSLPVMYVIIKPLAHHAFVMLKQHPITWMSLR